MSNNSNVWTPEDLEILAKYAPNGCAKIQAELKKRGWPRTAASIHNKARRLDIRIRRTGVTRAWNGWIKEEEAILIENAHLGGTVAAQALQDAGYERTREAARSHANAMGLCLGPSGPRQWTEEEIGILRTTAVHGHEAATRALQDAGYVRTKKAVSAKMLQLKLRDRICQHCGKRYRIYRGRRQCDHCGMTNPAAAGSTTRPGSNPPARKPLPRSISRACPRIEPPMSDPWLSGEISQRPHFRTPDPMYGF
jgi:hypothetical protein